jgi:hypothetical protein
MPHASQVLGTHIRAIDDIELGRAPDQLFEYTTLPFGAHVHVASAPIDDDATNERPIPPLLFHDREILQIS